MLSLTPQSPVQVWVPGRAVSDQTWQPARCPTAVRVLTWRRWWVVMDTGETTECSVNGPWLKSDRRTKPTKETPGGDT